MKKTILNFALAGTMSLAFTSLQAQTRSGSSVPADSASLHQGRENSNKSASGIKASPKAGHSANGAGNRIHADTSSTSRSGNKNTASLKESGSKNPTHKESKKTIGDGAIPFGSKDVD